MQTQIKLQPDEEKITPGHPPRLASAPVTGQVAQEILMTNTTREGRYTGPSLQADVAAKRNKTFDFVPVPAPVKLTKDQQAITDLHILGGIVAFGAWQTGTGNYKKARAVPEGAVVWSKSDTESYQYMPDMPIKPPKAPAHICTWFAAHPRALRCVAIL
jgi:hypothetical protein